MFAGNTMYAESEVIERRESKVTSEARYCQVPTCRLGHTLRFHGSDERVLSGWLRGAARGLPMNSVVKFLLQIAPICTVTATRACHRCRRRRQSDGVFNRIGALQWFALIFTMELRKKSIETPYIFIMLISPTRRQACTPSSVDIGPPRQDSITTRHTPCQQLRP